MTSQIIPWQDFPDFTQSIKLSNVVYTMRARWNTIYEYWTLDLYDKNGAALLIGQKLVYNTDILARYSDPRLPAGELFCVPLSHDADRIGRNDFGTNTILVFYEV